MSEFNPLLSICIPTFNRLHYLKESLDVLLPQAQKYGVEVCVSDNCSSDGTVDYLAQQADTFACLKFTVQKENIGLERNMVMCISMGLGRYVLPIGDDEVLPENSIYSILEELDEGVDVLILNGWHTDATLSKKTLHLPLSLQGELISSPLEAFELLWNKMPPGSFLAYRDCFQEKYFERYIGTSHAYTGSVWDVLAQKYRETGKCNIKCMAEPTVLLRGGEKSWRNDAAKIMLYEIPKWFSLLMENDEYKETIRKVRENYIKRQVSILTLLKYRAIGQLKCSEVEALSKELSFKQIERIKYVSRFPTPLSLIVVNMHEALKKVLKMMMRK